MNQELARFLDVWLPATASGTHRAFAWFEGPRRIHRVRYIKVGKPEQDRSAIEGLLQEHPELFFYAGTFSTNTTRSSAAEPIPLLWLDLDLADPRKTKLSQPTILWETSKGRYQALWMLLESLPPAERTARNRGLYEQLLPQGADLSFDASRRLRLPGSLNLKPGRKRWSVQVVESDMSRTYLAATFPRGSKRPEMETPDRPLPTAGSAGDAVKLLRAYGASSKLTADLNADIPAGERSLHMARLILAVQRLQMDSEEVFTVLSHARSNKFRDRPDQLWYEIMKATAKFQDTARPLLWYDYRTNTVHIRHITPTPASVEGGPKTLDDIVRVWSGPDEKKLTEARESRRWTLHNQADLIALEDIEWVYQDIWPVGGIGAVVGRPGARKSWVAVNFAVCMAAGQPFLDVDMETDKKTQKQRRGPVIYHCLDESPQLLKTKYQNITQALGVDPTTLEFHWSEAGFSFQLPPWQWVANLAEDIEAVKPTLVVIDGLYLAGYTPQDFGATTAALMAPLKEIRNVTNVGFLIVHHASKAGPGENTRIAGAGSVLLNAFFEIQWQVDIASEDKQQQVIDMQTAGKLSMQQKKRFNLIFGADPRRFDMRVEEAELCTEGELLEKIRQAQNIGLTSKQLENVTRLASNPLKRMLERLGKSGLIYREKTGKEHSWIAIRPTISPADDVTAQSPQNRLSDM